MRKLVILIPLLCLSLQGCLPPTATTGETPAVAKSDNINRHISDQEIEFSINNKIFGAQELYGNNHIIVEVYQGEVLLTGQVRSDDYRQQVINIAKNADGVKRVYDQLSISEPTSLGRQTKDGFITTSVKTRILGHIGMGITVVTEDGVVYLMGTVTRDNAEKATDIARTTDGVTKVVQIFTYLAPEPTSTEN